MYLRQTPRNGRIYLSIVESVRTGNTVRQTTIRSLGYLDQLKEQYDDPIAYYREWAKQETVKEKEEQKKERTHTRKSDEKMEVGTDDERNVGYVILKMLYKELEIDKFWKKKQREYEIQYDLNEIFFCLCVSRVLWPGSKLETFRKRDDFFETFDFSLNDMYRALDLFAKEEKSLQQWIFLHSKERYSRDMTYGYFDCTNYYFEIDNNDTDLIDEDGNVLEKNYRKRGPEKNHRPDPIIEMGLLMDSKGLPLAYDLFPGNESEKLHLRPALNRARNEFGIGRTIVVADRGLNTSDNIFFINGDNKGDRNHRDGYVYGQSVRGADKEFKDWVLKKEEYTTDRITDEDGETISFRHKSRIYPKTITISREMSNGRIKKQKITVDQKQMCYYSEKYAKRQKQARDEMVARAQDLIANPKKYDRISATGAKGYVINLSFNKETGEVIGKQLELDEERIREEEKYDGYYSIVTSELNMSDFEMRKVYRGLARIEDTFKVTKSTLQTRPVHVWTKESIEAHFMTCFTALVLVRLLEKRTGEKYSPEVLINSMKNYKCIWDSGNMYRLVHYDEINVECGKAFGLDLSQKYRTQAEMKKLLKY